MSILLLGGLDGDISGWNGDSSFIDWSLKTCITCMLPFSHHWLTPFEYCPPKHYDIHTFQIRTVHKPFVGDASASLMERLHLRSSMWPLSWPSQSSSHSRLSSTLLSNGTSWCTPSLSGWAVTALGIHQKDRLGWLARTTNIHRRREAHMKAMISGWRIQTPCYKAHR